MENPTQYFDNNSTVDVLYFTSDHLAFFDRDKAEEYAAQLEDTTVKDMTRAEVMEALEQMQLEQWDGVED